LEEVFGIFVFSGIHETLGRETVSVQAFQGLYQGEFGLQFDVARLGRD
jgi:hypothetical protein